MPEREDPKRRLLDLDSELGVTRRDLLRRGAVVGGTLLWVAPAIQSIAPAASAQAAGQGPSPGTCAVCYCFSGPADAPTKELCTNNGVAPFFGLLSHDVCGNWCKWNTRPTQVGVNAAPNGPYDDFDYCSGTTCTCSTSTDALALNGVQCS